VRQLEHILGSSGEPHLIDDLGGHQVLKGRVNAQRFEQVRAEPRANDRCCAQRAFRFRVEAVDASGDGCLQGGWHANFGDIGHRM
jgi:hypothetical protein